MIKSISYKKNAIGEKGKKVNTERKFFPGYMMIKMIMDDEIWHTVRTIPKVYGFLGGKKGEPIPVSQAEIDSIFNLLFIFVSLFLILVRWLSIVFVSVSFFTFNTLSKRKFFSICF